jgi:hypothetical protein
LAYHETTRWSDRCARLTRHWREDLVEGSRTLRWILLAPLALLINALTGRRTCWECAGIDELKDDPPWAGPVARDQATDATGAAPRADIV